MSRVGLEQFGAHQKTRQLLDLVAGDMEKLKISLALLSTCTTANKQRGFDPVGTSNDAMLHLFCSSRLG
jgi:hypothetical protein